MKKRSKQMIAAALSIMMSCTSFSVASMAENIGDEKGWRQENGEWSYYDKDGEKVTDAFRFSPTDIDKVWTVYYLNEEGKLVIEEGGSTLEYDGKNYELTAGGALKGNYLYKDKDEYYRYTEPNTGKVACNTWWNIKDEDGIYHWYYFIQQPKMNAGLGYALQDTVKGINETSYHFNELGHMSESELIMYEIYGQQYLIYAQSTGELAKDKWLYFDDKWHYFMSEEIPDWDMIMGVMSIGNTSVNGVDYTFDDNGALTSDDAPYEIVDSIELSGNKDTVYVGDTITIDTNILTASPSNAMADVATMSNASKQALIDDKSYDVTWVIERDGIVLAADSIKLNKSRSNRTDGLSYTYTPSVDGNLKITMMIDGIRSNTLDIDCTYNTQKADNSKYMKDVFEGLLNSALPSDVIISKVAGIYSALSEEEVSKLRDDDGIIKDLETFEKLYKATQGMNVYGQEFDKAANVINPSAVNVVGAFLNYDTSGSKMVVSMEEKVLPTEAAVITEEKKVALDISLNGGVSDTSKLEIPVTFTMPVPKGFASEGLKLYHIHNGQTTELKLSETQLKEGKVRFTTDSFSDFVFAGNAAGSNNSGGSSGSSGSGGGSSRASVPSIPETAGKWVQLENGKWQFLQPNGSLYVNTWIYVKDRWYFIDATGIMADGWQDINGCRYYLTPVNGAMLTGWLSDNTHWYYLDETGAMKTGWVTVNGKQYYLGTDGIMLTNTETPDGSKVDASGAKIQ